MGRHNTTDSLEVEVVKELSSKHNGDFYGILSELPGIAVARVIDAINDPSLTDEKKRITERTRQIAVEEGLSLEDIASRLGLSYTVFWRYRAYIGLGDKFLEEKSTELAIGLKNEYAQHWIKDVEFGSRDYKSILRRVLESRESNKGGERIVHLVDLLHVASRIPEESYKQFKLVAGSIDLVEKESWAKELFSELKDDGVPDPLNVAIMVKDRKQSRHGIRYFVEALDFYGLIPENKAMEYRLFGSAADLYDASPTLKNAPQFDDKMEAIRWAYDSKKESRDGNELRELSLKYIVTALAIGGKVKGSTVISLAGKADYALRNEELFKEELHQAYQSMHMEGNYNKEDGRFSKYKFMGNLFAGIDSTKFRRQDTNEPLSEKSLRTAFNMAMTLYGLKFLYSEFKDQRLNQLTL
jgi:hypothetical protein